MGYSASSLMDGRDQRHHALQQALRTARQAAGLTQKDVARRLGQPQSYVSKYEGGSRRLDLVEIVALCVVLGIRAQHLVEVVEMGQGSDEA